MTLGPGDVETLVGCIAAGGVALLPTDTVYGLACDPESHPAVERLYEIKGRPAAQPSAVMFFALDAALAALPELGARERDALCALLPGPLTLLLPNRARRYPLAGAPATGPADAPAAAEGDAARVAWPALGLRVPALPRPIAALAAMDRPVMQSSANLSGGPEARRFDQVPAPLRTAVDLALDGGDLPGVASTIIDLRAFEHDGRWRILREGPLAAADVQRALGSPA